MQLELFEKEECQIELEELFEAYFDCRKNKRNTMNAIAFEIDYESNLIELQRQINTNTYIINRSVAFIVNKPVKREIFAADFRDRVLHHWLINKINPLFESIFINESFACRKAKGTHYGINLINNFIKECSHDYTKDCYILKLDIQGFFMRIDKSILLKELLSFIKKHYHKPDKQLVLRIMGMIIENDPTKNCIIKGNKDDWKGLPANKSLFSSPSNCGLPIGNLTSQVFANFYLHFLDAFVKSKLNIQYYGRYVDDFILIHHDKTHLISLIAKISNFLSTKLKLQLHPKKIYLQPYQNGVKFLGVFIKPNRIYLDRRTKDNFYLSIQKINLFVVHQKPSNEAKQTLISSMNSYLGLMSHYATYRLRKRMLFKHLNGYWWNYVYLSGGCRKFVLKVRPAKKEPTKR